MAERKNVNNGDWDAKGDLLAGTANDAFDQVTVGANGTVLTADSAQTTGMAWVAPAAPSGTLLVSDFDAKGDLLVGTANDAFDQLAVGSAGRILIADATPTVGMKWIDQIQQYATGKYFAAPQGSHTADSTSVTTLNQLVYLPFFVWQALTVDRIGVGVQTLGASGVVRLGIYNSSDGVPSTLVLDAGTISSASTGYKEITISQALQPYTAYYFAYVSQVASCTLRAAAPGNGSNIFGYLALTDDPRFNAGLIDPAAQSGALPASAGTIVLGTSQPGWVRVRAV